MSMLHLSGTLISRGMSRWGARSQPKGYAGSGLLSM